MNANEEISSNNILSNFLLFWRELWNDVVEEFLGEIRSKGDEQGEEISCTALATSGWSEFYEDLL